MKKKVATAREQHPQDEDMKIMMDFVKYDVTAIVRI